MGSCQSKHTNRAAFSLLELLMVLAVVTILSGIGWSGATGLHGWLGERETRTLFLELQAACHAYRQEFGRWPPSLDNANLRLADGDSDWRRELAPFMERRIDNWDPRDGFGNRDIRLVLDRDGDHWIRGAELEGLVNGNVPDSIWARIVVYSLDNSGSLVAGSWEEE